MALPRKLLSKDEIVVRHMRTHPKVLLWRILIFMALLIIGAVITVLIPDADWRGGALIALWALVLVAIVPIFFIPWLRWRTTTYTVTSKRVITRSGIFNKVGHDLPLSRISDVQQERSITDRMFGCGSLSLQTSADEPLVLVDVPDVEMVQVEISNLLFHDVEGAVNADPDD
ncbi:PH domain-containing protein [Actinomyces sp. MRS3W]|uniref:PH domain-containing protein n=1 Tax=Actinomyces sp. MRS3W TaxID=2800796 RepID=UPI0028FD79B0|nr:PH domain-containing protein [Actinomyces sp. MRS3W]MDU0348887.1 PH domain-containing protein [Actinomyces sp. MRS3W]